MSDSANVTDIESNSDGANDESNYEDEDVEDDNDEDVEDDNDDDDEADIIEDDNSDDGNNEDSDIQSVEIIDKDIFIECVKTIFCNTLD